MGVGLRAEPFGATALLIWCTPDEVPAVAAEARRRWPAAIDVVRAAECVLVDGLADPGQAVSEVATWTVAAETREVGALITLPTRYDGPDLDEVARLWRTDPAGVVAQHASATFTVAFCGFAPGFAYCTTDARLPAVPRRSSPRARVEPGAVALADIYTGVYPTASPGGWQWIGQTDASLWDLSRDEPALLVPGTMVRFVAS